MVVPIISSLPFAGLIYLSFLTISSIFILLLIQLFYFLFINQNDNEINFALVPDIPESLEPIVEKANTFDNQSQSSDIKKNDLIIILVL